MRQMELQQLQLADVPADAREMLPDLGRHHLESVQEPDRSIDRKTNKCGQLPQTNAVIQSWAGLRMMDSRGDSPDGALPGPLALRQPVRSSISCGVPRTYPALCQHSIKIASCCFQRATGLKQ